MKQGVVLCSLAVMLLFASGCKKERSGAIEGAWELRQASGMIVINYPVGNGKKITFQGNYYEMWDNGQITKSGTFEIVADASVSASTCMVIPNGKYTRRIIYDSNTTAQKIFLQRDGNKLYFISGCFALDGGSVTEYVRL